MFAELAFRVQGLGSQASGVSIFAPAVICFRDEVLVLGGSGDLARRIEAERIRLCLMMLLKTSRSERILHLSAKSYTQFVAWEFPNIRGTLFGGPYSKDPSI